MERYPLVAAGWVLALAFAGCAAWPAAAPSTTPDRVWCAVRRTQCAAWRSDADGSPVECLAPVRDSNGSTALLPQDPPGIGRWACFDRSARSALEVCEDQCSGLDPVMNPPVVSAEGLVVPDAPRCVAAIVDAPGDPTDGVSHGECIASSPPLAHDASIPGPPSSPDLSGRLMGVGRINGDVVPVEGGVVSLKVPDPTCESSPAGRCRLRVNALELRHGSFSFGGRSVEGLKVFLAAPVDTVAAPVEGATQASFSIPSGTPLHVTGKLDGEQVSLVVDTPSEATAAYDWQSGAVTLSISFSGSIARELVEGAILVTTDPVDNRPPLPRAGEDQVVVADGACEATVLLDGADSWDADGDLRELVWSTDTALLGSGPVAQVALPVGEHVVRLAAFDEAGAYTFDEAVVTVEGGMPPEFVAPEAEVEVKRCGPGSSEVTLAVPEAADPCSGEAAEVTGRVVLAGGEEVSIPVVDGRAALPPGTSVVAWTATIGSRTTVFPQTVRVVWEPTLFATRSLVIGDRVEVLAGGGALGAAMNVGAEPTIIGNDARLGDVFSLSPVTVLDRAALASLHHGGVFELGDQVTIGAIVADTGFARPELALLPAASGGEDITLEPDRTRTLPPRGYGNVVVKSRSLLTLGSGTTTMRRLELSPEARLVVPSDGSARLFVRDQLVFEGTVASRIAGARSGLVPAPIFLGSGGAEVKLKADFWGVAVVPGGRLMIEGGSAAPWAPPVRGRFYAQSIDVQAGTRLVHDDVFCAAR